MLIHIVSDKPKIKRSEISCDTCEKYRLCIQTMDKKSMCRTCYKAEKKDKYTSVMYCEICCHLSLESDIKWCSYCGKTIGVCCGALYHCQSSECTCKMCFNYKCEQCNEELSRGEIYVLDGGDECAPLCERCKIRALL